MLTEPELTDALLERMLRAEEARRFDPRTIERMRAKTLAGGEWLDVVADLQREIALAAGFRSVVGIASAVHRMRTAHVGRPDLAPLSVYGRANLAADGALAAGARCPDVPLRALDGARTSLHRETGTLTVIAAGSWT